MPINPTLHKSMFSMLTIILFNVLEFTISLLRFLLSQSSLKPPIYE